MKQDLVELPRSDVVFTIGFALWQHGRKKTAMEICQAQAEAIVAHFELSNWRVVRPAIDWRPYFPADPQGRKSGGEP